MEKRLEEEWIILDNMYDEYEDKYLEMIDKLKIETEVWSSSFYYNLYPLQIELSGYKHGKLYKSEPKTKKNVVVSGFVNDELNYVGLYDGLSSVSLEYVSIREKNKVTFLGYYKKRLNRIYINCLGLNGELQYTLLLFIDHNIKRYVKEIYTLNNGKIEKIKEIGVRKKKIRKSQLLTWYTMLFTIMILSKK